MRCLACRGVRISIYTTDTRLQKIIQGRRYRYPRNIGSQPHCRARLSSDCRIPQYLLLHLFTLIIADQASFIRISLWTCRSFGEVCLIQQLRALLTSSLSSEPSSQTSALSDDLDLHTFVFHLFLDFVLLVHNHNSASTVCSLLLSKLAPTLAPAPASFWCILPTTSPQFALLITAIATDQTILYISLAPVCGIFKSQLQIVQLPFSTSRTRHRSINFRRATSFATQKQVGRPIIFDLVRHCLWHSISPPSNL